MIVCRSRAEIQKLRRVNQLVGRILAQLRQMVAPGCDDEGDRCVRRSARTRSGRRTGVQGVSRISSDRVRVGQRGKWSMGFHRRASWVDGDVLSLDMGAKLDGFYGDCAVTVPVGRVSADAARLLRVTEAALFRGIDAVKPGARVSDIGAAVQAHVEAHGFSVVREFVGHRHRHVAARGAADRELRPCGPRTASGRRHGARDRGQW